ncbi:MAG: uracil-DNA glycosylase [Alphaproteobacteria bacterium]|nr:uracil-DNA glycosylase [Alphaproteobacteria bacterium]
MVLVSHEPSLTCALCPRLTEFRIKNKNLYPTWHNAPVPSFGDFKSNILIVGLAPGLQGANRTGRPFTGDYAGDLLYQTLLDFNLATGVYDPEQPSLYHLKNVRITNAVRCVPPENKPESQEINHCLPFLKSEIAAMVHLKIILTLGTIAHNSVLKALDYKKTLYPFKHGASYPLTPSLILVNSYHCSRYNTNTGRLTSEMFQDVFRILTKFL